VLAKQLSGLKSIPNEWFNKLARRKDIEDLTERLSKKTYNNYD